MNARGEGPLAQGHVRGSGDYVGAFQVEGPGAPPHNGGVQVYIEDNGKPQNGQPVDRVATEPPQEPELFDAAAGVCTDPTLNPAWNRIETGDYTVRDAG
ncbi:MAG TPA: hypothetical protein VFY47_05365 [Thermoleophilaceae bacterium]|nr:hypothetical protein [Thermoleophilaceae bacterium]